MRWEHRRAWLPRLKQINEIEIHKTPQHERSSTRKRDPAWCFSRSHARAICGTGSSSFNALAMQNALSWIYIYDLIVVVIILPQHDLSNSQVMRTVRPLQVALVRPA